MSEQPDQPTPDQPGSSTPDTEPTTPDRDQVGDEGGDDGGDDGSDEHHDGAVSPAVRAGGEMVAAASTSAPPPPRRTGIFVDVGELRAHVGDLLRAMLGGYQVDAFGNMTFTHEGARVFVTVGPGPLGPQVGVFSITNVDVPLTGELASFLLTSNHRLAFGAFSYDAENAAVWLRHSLLGGTLDGPELRGAVLAIAQTAARVDDVIRERHGGRRFVDAGEEEQARTHPPAPEPEADDVANASGYL